MIKTFRSKRRFCLPLQNAEGKHLVQSEDKTQLLDSFFTNIFHAPTDNLPKLTDSDITLHNPITPQEVGIAISKLNNGRAPGPDGLPNELIKIASSPQLNTTIAEMFNTNSWGEYLGQGEVIPLPKQKKRIPDNIRPIVLLNSTRKVLSIIILERTRPVVEQFIRPEQCGFRHKRGTADAVWAHRMIVSKALKYNTKFHILGLDMSKAFDTVNRSKLLEVLSSFLDSDSIILIRMLMENTTNCIQLENTLG